MPLQVTWWTGTLNNGDNVVIDKAGDAPGVYVVTVDLDALGATDTVTVRARGLGDDIHLMACTLSKTAGATFGAAVVSDPIIWPDNLEFTGLEITLDAVLAGSVTSTVRLMRVA